MGAISKNVIYIILFWSFYARSESELLRKEQVESAVLKISDLIKNHYVFEERGNKISTHFLQSHKEQKFDSVKSWSEFADLSTKILQDFSNDGHLFVRYDPRVVKELSTNDNSESQSEDPFFHSDEARERNFGFEKVKVLQGNLGYIKLSEINISDKSLPTLFAAMDFLANTKALILDLKDNGGGGSEVGPVLESMFLPKDIALLEFKSRNEQTTTERTVAWLTRKRYANPLFIVINKKTASAAEALTFALKANKRAIVVGQTSAGAAHMNSWYVVNDEVFVSISTGAPTLPGTETTWEGIGIQPDHTVKEGDEIEFIKTLFNP